MSQNPFLASTSRPGEGHIILKLLPPAKPVLQTLSYQYPLKLIAPAAVQVEDTLIHTVFLLTYGGGLVAGDAVNLQVFIAGATRLVLLTQGSTKIFKTEHPDTVTRQETHVHIDDDGALCYLPDPVQPFATCNFEQRQMYHIKSEMANLCVCDWVNEGRTARGEKWSFRSYTSRNEVWSDQPNPRLLLRDNVILCSSTGVVAARMENLGVFGTLIIHGPLFLSLASFFAAEYKLLPRIGAKQWDPIKTTTTAAEQVRAFRLALEDREGVMWTVAETRGFVVVKFGAHRVEGARSWLHNMLAVEGSVVKLFGERALMCLK